MEDLFITFIFGSKNLVDTPLDISFSASESRSVGTVWWIRIVRKGLIILGRVDIAGIIFLSILVRGHILDLSSQSCGLWGDLSICSGWLWWRRDLIVIVRLNCLFVGIGTCILSIIFSDVSLSFWGNLLELCTFAEIGVNGNECLISGRLLGIRGSISCVCRSQISKLFGSSLPRNRSFFCWLWPLLIR